jgi:surface polysaccharide O-acyltransferase-like enzyme
MDRIRSVDTFRVLAICAVIALHTARYAGPDAVGLRLDTATALNQLERFAVPMFFIFSGYFWAQKCAVPRDYLVRSLQVARRVLLIYLVWALVYLAVTALGLLWTQGPGGLLPQLVHARRTGRLGLAHVFLEGGTIHLWFLPALACALLASGALLALGMRRLLVLLAVLLCAIGLAGGAYAHTPLGFHARFNLRDGPFFSLIFFVTGAELARRRLPASPWPGLVLALAGFSLQVLEVHWLHARWGANYVQDYVAATWLYGLGMGMLALSDAPSLRLPALASLGPLVLGIYASHYLFVDLLRPLDEAWHGGAWSTAWGLAYVMLVFAGALGLTWVLARFALTRRFVM